jgi:hypothetical protein
MGHNMVQASPTFLWVFDADNLAISSSHGNNVPARSHPRQDRALPPRSFNWCRNIHWAGSLGERAAMPVVSNQSLPAVFV